MKDIAIKIDHLSKRYAIGKEKDSSLRGTLSNLFKGSSGAKDEFWALKDINLEINRGDVVGIIGKNGAGKSTLLKILSQITQPTEGRIEINGRVASLLEVGTGFHPELTGRENIYLNGTILGMTRKEVKAKFDEIATFSGVEKFIDTPVKHYSSGMYVRLAFSVAAHLEPEILIIDEVLAVGDAEFQKRCLGKMEDVASNGRTVLFVSHNMAAVKSLCTRGVFLGQGKLRFSGNINETIQSYISSGEMASEFIANEPIKKIDVAFKRIRVLNEGNKSCSDFTVDDNIFLNFEFQINSHQTTYSVFVIIKNKLGVPIFSAEQKITSPNKTLILGKRGLTRGQYSITTFIHIPRVRQIDRVDDTCSFTITDSSSDLSIHGDYDYGSVFGKYKWQ